MTDLGSARRCDREYWHMFPSIKGEIHCMTFLLTQQDVNTCPFVHVGSGKSLHPPTSLAAS